MAKNKGNGNGGKPSEGSAQVQDEAKQPSAQVQGKANTAVTDEDRARLAEAQAKERADREAEKLAKTAEKNAEREAAKAAKLKQKEADKVAADAAKAAHAAEVEAALAGHKEAISECETAVGAAKSALDAANDNLKAAKAAYRQAGGKLSDSDGGTVDRRYTANYVTHDTKTANGRKSINSGDEVAIALMGMNSEQVYEVLTANGMEPGIWDHLNEGMKKMNATNKLRAAHKKGVSLTIGTSVLPGVPQAEKPATPQAEAEGAAA